MPIDTYNKNIDSVVEPKYERDWEALRGEIIAQGGIRNTTLIAYMPGESSSKASGTCNAIYPVRDVAIMKTDNDITVYWAAPDGDLLNEYYEKAWDIPSKDMTEVYGIIQKFTDQSISADEWRKIVGSEKISTDEMLQNFFHKLKMGNKTSYYMDTHTAGKVVLRKEAEKQQETDVKFVEDDSQGCASGACSL